MTSYTGFSWTRDVELLEKHNSYPEKKKLLEKVLLNDIHFEFFV